MDVCGLSDLQDAMRAARRIRTRASHTYFFIIEISPVLFFSVYVRSALLFLCSVTPPYCLCAAHYHEVVPMSRPQVNPHLIGRGGPTIAALNCDSFSRRGIVIEPQEPWLPGIWLLRSAIAE